uniref:Efflux RND transporter periplasmic adaptor subunit n=1 Tax=Desulfobacca acetoxidans TaxID=60893 RepID=A0A7C3Z304_9BACT
MKISKRGWGLTLLTVAALVFMLWLADLLHFGKILPGTLPLQAVPEKGRELVVQEEEISQDLSVLAQVMSRSLAQVSSQVPGRVSRIYVQAGSRVQAGAPLVALSAKEFQARVSQARAGHSQAAAQLAKVSADYRRYQRLFKEGAVSPQEFEAMEARYKSALAQLNQAEAQVQDAATFEQYTVVKAPRRGVVAERRVAVGDLAQPGQTLVTLYDPEDLQVEGEVNDAYRSHLSPGMLVGLTVPAAGYEGKVTLQEIFPISAAQSRTFKVRTEKLVVPDLIPGMFARLTIPLGKTRSILIPKDAVRQVGQLPMTEVLVQGRPRLQLLQLGRQVGDKVEVLSGLRPGDRIISPPEK